ncbi:hypothetical protein [Scytonema hofmannii]|uniref:hypothetical protein n=1 Tax=Scytonema hofmannii TaxID=34078 RepID=UPI001314A0E0|nr:hypothetical protein [Scytonema hofmannii]
MTSDQCILMMNRPYIPCGTGVLARPLLYVRAGTPVPQENVHIFADSVSYTL